MDLLIHTWNLARAIEVDEALPPEISERVLALMRQSNGPSAVKVGTAQHSNPVTDAVPQAQLIAFAGRAVQA